MTRISGFVMISVLLFLQLFALLGLYAWANVANEMRHAQYKWQREKYFYSANQWLVQIEKNVMKAYPSCMIDIMATADINKQDILWWRTHACEAEEGGEKYYYTIERLAKDPCVQMIDVTREQRYEIDYIRISLYTPFSKLPDTSLLLQSVVVVPQQIATHCQDQGQDQTHVVKKGRQMWQEI